MKAIELRNNYLKFFESKQHKIISGAKLIPENDPTVLFTTAGMHPLVPYLTGQTHPQGTRLVDYQKCLRTDDIDEVGDNRHLTFFEMLGNWSLGDYFKQESIRYSYEFLTDVLGIDKESVNDILVYYNSKNNNLKLTIPEFVKFIIKLFNNIFTLSKNKLIHSKSEL